MKFIAYLTSMVFLSGCSSLLYFPSSNKFYDPSQLQLQYEDVTFKDANGTEIHAWWFPARTKDSKGTVVYFHGNAENLSSHFISMSWLPGEGYNYLIFDYPGYGLSDGKPSPEANLAAGEAAIRWVQKNKDQRPLIIYGQSMGGIVAMRTVLEMRPELQPKVVVSDASFYSFQKIARHKMSLSWVTWLFQPLAYVVFSDKYSMKGKVGEISPTPLLIIHGQKDIVVEPHWSDEMYEMAREPKLLWRIPEGYHGDSFWVADKKYRKQFLEYLDTLK